jgi:hypothetical protein
MIALAAAILLLVGQVALMRLVPATGVPAYMLTVGILELLENAGFRTLMGSPDGWPVPTDLGLTIAAVSEYAGVRNVAEWPGGGHVGVAVSAKRCKSRVFGEDPISGNRR